MEYFEEIITIDGPAGAGKSTLARALARRLDWTYLDTGALYRAIGLASVENRADPGDAGSMGELLEGLEVSIRTDSEVNRVFLNGREITSDIRQPEVSTAASQASALPVVRAALLDIQRNIGQKGQIVVEGRDMGTVVFPRAGIKFFLEASLEERAKRRYKELIALGHKVGPEEVLEQMEARDRADFTRSLSPLSPAADAVRIDATVLSVDEVMQLMLKVIEEKIHII